jgi:hypothetical protein
LVTPECHSISFAAGGVSDISTDGSQSGATVQAEQAVHHTDSGQPLAIE